MFLNLFDHIDPTDHQAVISGQGIYADQILEDAIAVSRNAGYMPAFIMPNGLLRFSETIHLKDTVSLIGHNDGQTGSPGTVLRFDQNKTGVINDATGEEMFGGHMLIDRVWAHAGSWRFKEFNFLDVLNRLEALESQEPSEPEPEPEPDLSAGVSWFEVET